MGRIPKTKMLRLNRQATNPCRGVTASSALPGCTRMPWSLPKSGWRHTAAARSIGVAHAQASVRFLFCTFFPRGPLPFLCFGRPHNIGAVLSASPPPTPRLSIQLPPQPHPHPYTRHLPTLAMFCCTRRSFLALHYNHCKKPPPFLAHVASATSFKKILRCVHRHSTL